MANERADADTFPKLLIDNAKTRGSRVAMRHKDLGIWQSWTWGQMADEVRAFSAGLEELGLKRGDTSGTLPPAALTAVFRAPKGEPATAEGKEPTERIVFVVTEITVPPLDFASADAKKLSDNLRNTFADELLNQYIIRIQTDLGAKVSQSALNQAIGGSAN